MNEQLVTGREAIFFGAEYAASAGTNKLPDDTVNYYVDRLASNSEALHGSFAWYRAIHTTIAQNQQRKERRLTVPGPVTDRTFEITFLDPGVRAYAFTFG